MAAVERRCELCSRHAVVYCKIDKAYLCTDCDEQVHGANLLVRRHFHRRVQNQARTSLLGTGSAERVETLKNSFQNGGKPIEAIGSRWGCWLLGIRLNRKSLEL
jgi:hypothetical protein